MLLSKAPYPRRSPALVVLSLMLVALLGQGALAQQVDIKVRAKELVSKGLQSQVAGRFNEAIEFYKAAYDLVPHPELLFNLGQAHRLKGDRVVALDYYRKYLAIQPDGRAAKEAQEWMDQLERSMREEAAEAARKFEEQRLAEEARRAEAARQAEEERRSREDKAAAAPVASPAVSQAAPSPRAPAPAATVAPRPFPWQKGGAVVLGAASVASLVLSLHYRAQAYDKYDDYRKLVDIIGEQAQTTEDAYDEANSLRHRHIGFGVAGGVLLAAGIALWLSPPLLSPPRSETAAAGLAPLIDEHAAGLVYVGGF